MHRALVLVWFGPWRPWINLYIQSCRHNSAIDFLIFTDQPAPAAAAPNVRIIPFTRQQAAERIRARLGLDPRLDRAGKWSDYKPAYGELFADYLARYSHWGYCDEDLLWGRLDHFLSDELLAVHDIVTSCRCCVVGQLTLLRNEPKTNQLFQRVPDWRAILLNPSTLDLAENLLDRRARIEEAAGQLRVWRHQIQLHDVYNEAWSAWANQLELAECGRPHPMLKHGPAVWRNGGVHHARSGEEFAFFHFQSWKKRWALPPIPLPPPELDEWWLGADGILFSASGGATPATRQYVTAYRRASRRARWQRFLSQNWQIGDERLVRWQSSLCRHLYPATS